MVEESVTIEEARKALYLLRRYVAQNYICTSHSATALNWSIAAIEHFILGKFIEAGRFICHAEERMHMSIERKIIDMSGEKDMNAGLGGDKK